MTSETKDRIRNLIEIRSPRPPSPIEFEMAYQIRIVMDRIKCAIQHAEQFSKPWEQMREASVQLLDALDRLESVDRRFQLRTRINRFRISAAQRHAVERPLGLSARREICTMNQRTAFEQPLIDEVADSTSGIVINVVTSSLAQFLVSRDQAVRWSTAIATVSLDSRLWPKPRLKTWTRRCPNRLEAASFPGCLDYGPQ
jgi:hypothetical protein